MKKNSIVFIDTSAWCSIVDGNDPRHNEAVAYFSLLLNSGARLVTSSLVIDDVASEMKSRLSTDAVRRFLGIIDESVFTVNLRVDWASRRIRRSVLDHFLKSDESGLSLRHFYIAESLKRKRADILFSFDSGLKKFDIPVMPQNTP